MKYFEDFNVGEEDIVGTYVVGADDIIALAEKWDPQPMHLAGAANGPIASGVHLMAIAVRSLVTQSPKPAVIAGLGWDEVRFLHPVRSEDSLTIRKKCIEARLSKSQRGRGIIRNRVEISNQNGEVVLSYLDAVMVACRNDVSIQKGHAGAT